MHMFNFNQSCICVFVYLYLGYEGVVVDEWIVNVISFQKIFGLCGLKGHIVKIRLGVTIEDNGRRNMKIGLKFWKQNSQFDIFLSRLQSWVLGLLDRLLGNLRWR